MTISLKSDASGNSGSIQVAGVDRLTLNLDGSLMASANPATGTRSMALATMQKFADEFGASLTANGYQKLPSGLIIQWGTTASIAGAGGTLTTTFPVAFPSSCLSAAISRVVAGAAYQAESAVTALSNTQITIANASTNASAFRFIVVGF